MEAACGGGEAGGPLPKATALLSSMRTCTEREKLQLAAAVNTNALWLVNA